MVTDGVVSGFRCDLWGFCGWIVTKFGVIGKDEKEIKKKILRKKHFEWRGSQY